MSKQLERIDEYLAGRLQGDELDEFETEMLSDLELQKTVILQTQMKDGLTEAASSLKADITEASSGNFWGRISDLLWRPQFAYGLSVIVMAGIFLSVPEEKPDNFFVKDVIYIDQTRSAKPIDISLISGEQFLLALELNSSSPALVTLTQEDNELLSLQNAEPNEAGSINVILPALKTGEYQLSVTSAESAKIYSIIVRDGIK